MQLISEKNRTDNMFAHNYLKFWYYVERLK